MVRQENREHEVYKDNKVNKEDQVFKDLPENVVKKAQEGWLDNLAFQDLQEKLVPMVALVHQDLLVMLDNVVQLVYQVPQVYLDSLVLKVMKAPGDSLAHEVKKVVVENVDEQDNVVFQDLADHLVTLELLESTEKMVTGDNLVKMVSQDHQANLVHVVFQEAKA